MRDTGRDREGEVGRPRPRRDRAQPHFLRDVEDLRADRLAQLVRHARCHKQAGGVLAASNAHL